MENFKITFSQMVKNPYTVILLFVFMFANAIFWLYTDSLKDELAQANDIPVILAKVEQSIIEHQIINDGVRKASKLIPHNTII